MNKMIKEKIDMTLPHRTKGRFAMTPGKGGKSLAAGRAAAISRSMVGGESCSSEPMSDFAIFREVNLISH